MRCVRIPGDGSLRIRTVMRNRLIRCVKAETLNRKAAAFCAVAFLRQMEGAANADSRMQIVEYRQNRSFCSHFQLNSVILYRI